MVAEADRRTVFEDHDLVGIDDGCDALSHDDDRRMSRNRPEFASDRGVRMHVESGERIVEDEDPGSADHRSGDGETLFLSAREIAAALRDR